MKLEQHVIILITELTLSIVLPIIQNKKVIQSFSLSLSFANEIRITTMNVSGAEQPKNALCFYLS
jgi:hypothetical protein